MAGKHRKLGVDGLGDKRQQGFNLVLFLNMMWWKQCWCLKFERVEANYLELYPYFRLICQSFTSSYLMSHPNRWVKYTILYREVSKYYSTTKTSYFFHSAPQLLKTSLVITACFVISKCFYFPLRVRGSGVLLYMLMQMNLMFQWKKGPGWLFECETRI